MSLDLTAVKFVQAKRENDDKLSVTPKELAGVIALAAGASVVAVAADELAIPITHRVVQKTTGADAEALTLADGDFVGQRININLVTDGGGTGTLTPTTALNFVSVAFADAGDAVELEWTASGWIIIAAYGATAQPAIALS